MQHILKIIWIVSMVYWADGLPYAKLLTKAQRTFVDTSVRGINFALGTAARSVSVSNAMKSVRGEDSWEAKESLNQAIVTLAVLDIGGGVLLPLTDRIIELITENQAFKNTMKAWGIYNEYVQNLFKKTTWNRLGDANTRALIKAEKSKVIKAFSDNLDTLPSKGTKLKYLNKAQKWLKLKSAAKVLGPLFDAIGIGVNAWGLHMAIQTCKTTPSKCNKGTIASASLGIISGVVGIVTFFAVLAGASAMLGPVGFAVSVVLAITAALIDLIYSPPVTQEMIDAKRQQYMKKLDICSRKQLFAIHKFLAKNDMNHSDVYVVNQAFLPKYKTYLSQDARNLEVHITFGSIGAKLREIKAIKGSCEEPIAIEGKKYLRNLLHQRNEVATCPYLVEGHLLHNNYTFYGLAPDSKTNQPGASSSSSSEGTAKFSGFTVLVNTNHVQESMLQNADPDGHLTAKVRGVNINTYRKSRGKDSDDIVAIGKIDNLDVSEKIVVKMGHGNNALNIDGIWGNLTSHFANILDADLGISGYNILSFLGLSHTSPIKGIRFNATSGKLQYYHGDSRSLHHVGTVKYVDILLASTFDDYIVLNARNHGDSPNGFAVFNLKGNTTYEIDLEQVRKGGSFRCLPFDKRSFKIVDNSDNGENSGDKCNNYKPLLIVKNFKADTVPNDIHFDGKEIKIYEKISRPASDVCPEELKTNTSGDNKELIANISFIAKCKPQIQALKRNGERLMEPRYLYELDLMFIKGKKVLWDTKETKVGTYGPNDVAVMICPTSIVENKSDLVLSGGTNDTLVLSSDLFMDPCDIDGKNINMTLEKFSNKEHDWLLTITDKNKKKWKGNGQRHLLDGVDQIVNEYGDIVFTLNPVGETKIDLYDTYSKVTMKSMADITGIRQSTEIKENLLACYKKREDTDTELRQICALSDKNNSSKEN